MKAAPATAIPAIAPVESVECDEDEAAAVALVLDAGAVVVGAVVDEAVEDSVPVLVLLETALGLASGGKGSPGLSMNAESFASFRWFSREVFAFWMR